MVVMMKLAHVDELSGGRKRFRRRFPKALVSVIGEERLQVAMTARDGAPLVNEHSALMASYDKNIAKAKRKAMTGGTLSPREHWREVMAEAQAMVAGVIGPETEEEKRGIVADVLETEGTDPALYKAVVRPDAAEPPITLQDARNMYVQEKLKGMEEGLALDRLNRVCRRIEAALGPLHKWT